MSFFARRTCWDLAVAVCHRYVTSALEASRRRDKTTKERIGPLVGLEVRKPTRDISRGLDLANIYADSPYEEEHFDAILYLTRISLFSFRHRGRIVVVCLRAFGLLALASFGNIPSPLRSLG